jgi:hypothetical protein
LTNAKKASGDGYPVIAANSVTRNPDRMLASICTVLHLQNHVLLKLHAPLGNSKYKSKYGQTGGKKHNNFPKNKTQ